MQMPLCHFPPVCCHGPLTCCAATPLCLWQVWVPTEFNRRTFIAAGVDPAKLRVVEEGAGSLLGISNGESDLGMARSAS